MEAQELDLDGIYDIDDVEDLEAYGERLLDLAIQLVSERDWKEWVWASVQVAAVAGNSQAFHRLLNVGPRISALCTRELWVHHLFCCAARGGSIDIFSCLVGVDGFLEAARGDSECSEEKKRDLDRSLLSAAADGGSVAILSALYDIDGGFLSLAGTGNGIGDIDYGPSPLYLAAFHGHARFAAALIEAGAYVSRAALEAAVVGGHEDVLLELLPARVDITPQGQNTSLLYTAVIMNNAGVVDVLAAAGEDLDGCRGNNEPHLHAAARQGYCRPLENLLLAGADVNCVDSKGRTALHVACSYSEVTAAEVLLRHNANVASLCDEGLSAHDVVAVETLKSREGWTRRRRWRSRQRRGPSTLDAAQTLIADRICAMLKRAGAWGRRGWVIMLRARRQGSGKVVDASSLTFSSMPAKVLCKDVTASHGAGLMDEDADPASTATDFRCNSNVADQGLKGLLANVTTGESREKSVVQRIGVVGWKEAVEWLTQCPDERGIFREILSFL